MCKRIYKFKEPLLWLPPVIQEVFSGGRRDQVRFSVSPLKAALREAAGRYGDLRIRSLSDYRA